MIIVDTNLIVYLFLEGEFSSQAEIILKMDAEWAAPYLWRSEFRNVLAQYLRKKIISLPVALEIIQKAELLMRGREYHVPSAQVLSLISISSCSAYDCEFVALAKNLSVSLVTADKKIAKIFPDVAVEISKFATE